MRKMMKLAAPLAGAAALVAVLAGPSTADGAMTIGGTASLVAKGAGVLVPVEVTCGATGPSPMPSTVFVQLRQRSGNRLAEGNGSAPLQCDGTAHTVEALVNAEGAPFKPGVALASASGFVCDMFGCYSMFDTADVRIRN